MGLPSPVSRQVRLLHMRLTLCRGSNRKVTKPQFFESYRTERDNSALLDVAAGYMARKAVASHPDSPSHEGDGAASWGGMASRAVLATELVPMAVKIQHLTNSKWQVSGWC